MFGSIGTMVAIVSALHLTPGTYVRTNPGMPASGPHSRIVVRNASGGGRSFTVDAVRPGDLDTGTIAGLLPSADLPATWTHRGAYTNCRLTFERRGPREIDILQDERFGDCGFGYGVRADGTYRLVDSR